MVTPSSIFNKGAVKSTHTGYKMFTVDASLSAFLSCLIYIWLTLGLGIFMLNHSMSGQLIQELAPDCETGFYCFSWCIIVLHNYSTFVLTEYHTPFEGVSVLPSAHIVFVVIVTMNGPAWLPLFF